MVVFNTLKCRRDSNVDRHIMTSLTHMSLNHQEIHQLLAFIVLTDSTRTLGTHCYRHCHSFLPHTPLILPMDWIHFSSLSTAGQYRSAPKYPDFPCFFNSLVFHLPRVLLSSYWCASINQMFARFALFPPQDRSGFLPAAAFRSTICSDFPLEVHSLDAPESRSVFPPVSTFGAWEAESPQMVEAIAVCPPRVLPFRWHVPGGGPWPANW